MQVVHEADPNTSSPPGDFRPIVPGFGRDFNQSRPANITPEFAQHIENQDRRRQALESIRVTGNIVKDARALFEAAEMNIASFPGPHRAAIEAGNAVGILQYLKLRKEWEHLPFAEMSETDKEFWRVFQRVLQEIIVAAEHGQ